GLDYFEYGPQMSRGFRALKVWMTLKHYGADGYRRLLSQGLRCAERLHELVRTSEDFHALHEPNLYIYSFRYAPREVSTMDEIVDKLNQEIADEIQARGIAFIMTTKIHDKTVLRMSICSHRTTPADIEEVFGALVRIGREKLQALSE
ncbi:MAG: pyridoxal-dependent decarboxylase, partial [Anaerolineales bacterium]